MGDDILTSILDNIQSDYDSLIESDNDENEMETDNTTDCAVKLLLNNNIIIASNDVWDEEDNLPLSIIPADKLNY